MSLLGAHAILLVICHALAQIEVKIPRKCYNHQLELFFIYAAVVMQCIDRRARNIDNVASTSMQRHDVATALYNVMCQLGKEDCEHFIRTES